MDDTEPMETGAHSAGVQLRDAREKAGLSVAEVAARTRIPQRHLEAIERDDFAALPSTTYSVGFARAFARTIGADEVAIAAAVRAQLEQSGRERHAYQAFEPADPARVPPRSLAWTAAIVALLILAGYGIWRMSWRGSDEAPPQVAVAPDATPGVARGPTPAATPTSGPVVLTATDEVWIKVTDSSGKALVQKALKAGESYPVPAGAQEPKLTFSRPEVLTVTVGGTAVPPLGPPAKLVKNAVLTPAALRARMTGSPSPTPAR